jgi:hypothetical protein
MSTVKARRRLPEQVAEAMNAILEYLWSDEARNYVNASRAEQVGHIFQEMLTVRHWLDHRKKPQEPKKSTRTKSTAGKLLT